MCTRRSISIAILLFLLVSLGREQIKGSTLDSPFSFYAGNASWETEMVFLYNFAFYLHEFPEMIGHVVYFSSKTMSRTKLEKRLRRSIKYLTKDRRVPRDRLKVYFGGTNQDSYIVLQPIKSNTEPEKVVLRYVQLPNDGDSDELKTLVRVMKDKSPGGAASRRRSV